MSSVYQDYLGDSFDPETGEFNIEQAEINIENNKSKINILLCGASGVGKSTLINAMFGENIVETGVGKPVTQYLEKIEIKSKGLMLWDTKGIEAKDYSATKDQLIKDIENGFIDALSKKDDSLPHIAWLCINETSNRVEEREKDLLEITKKFGIPTIVVFTNTQEEDGEAFFNAAKNILDEDYGEFINNRYVRVNSIAYKFRGMHVPEIGLEELLSMNESCLEDALQNASDKQDEYDRKKRLAQIEALKKAQRINSEKKLKAMIESSKKAVHIASAAAGAAGASPIPGSDAPIIAAIQSTLIKTLNSEFDVDEKSSNVTSVISSMLAVTGIAQVGKTIVSGILKFIPGAGTVVGGAISASTATLLTQAIGHAYIKVLEYYFDKDKGRTVLPSEAITIMSKFKEFYKV